MPRPLSPRPHATRASCGGTPRTALYHYIIHTLYHYIIHTLYIISTALHGPVAPAARDPRRAAPPRHCGPRRRPRAHALPATGVVGRRAPSSSRRRLARERPARRASGPPSRGPHNHAMHSTHYTHITSLHIIIAPAALLARERRGGRGGARRLPITAPSTPPLPYYYLNK
jgi:hypothetical protein